MFPCQVPFRPSSWPVPPCSFIFPTLGQLAPLQHVISCWLLQWSGVISSSHSNFGCHKSSLPFHIPGHASRGHCEPDCLHFDLIYIFGTSTRQPRDRTKYAGDAYWGFRQTDHGMSFIAAALRTPSIPRKYLDPLDSTFSVIIYDGEITVAGTTAWNTAQHRIAPRLTAVDWHPPRWIQPSGRLYWSGNSSIGALQGLVLAELWCHHSLRPGKSSCWWCVTHLPHSRGNPQGWSSVAKLCNKFQWVTPVTTRRPMSPQQQLQLLQIHLQQRHCRVQEPCKVALAKSWPGTDFGDVKTASVPNMWNRWMRTKLEPEWMTAWCNAFGLDVFGSNAEQMIAGEHWILPIAVCEKKVAARVTPAVFHFMLSATWFSNCARTFGFSFHVVTTWFLVFAFSSLM